MGAPSCLACESNWYHIVHQRYKHYKVQSSKACGGGRATQKTEHGGAWLLWLPAPGSMWAARNSRHWAVQPVHVPDIDGPPFLSDDIAALTDGKLGLALWRAATPAVHRL